MSDENTAPMRRKTEQAIKVSASWTPNERAARDMMIAAFGERSPLILRGGRLTINAAIALDMTDPAATARTAERVVELRSELEAEGTVHSFAASAGSVPVGEAERLPAGSDKGEDSE